MPGNEWNLPSVMDQTHIQLMFYKGVSARLVAATGFKPVVRVGDIAQVGSIPIHSRFHFHGR